MLPEGIQSGMGLHTQKFTAERIKILILLELLKGRCSSFPLLRN